MTDFGMPTLIEIPDLEQSAALCRRLGLKFMEINMSFPQYQPECLDADKLLELKEKYGIYFTVHIDESLDPACVNAGVAQAYLDTMLKTVVLAKKAGISCFTDRGCSGHYIKRSVQITLPVRIPLRMDGHQRSKRTDRRLQTGHRPINISASVRQYHGTNRHPCSS